MELDNIIRELEQQRDALTRAIETLRDGASGKRG